jgi:hypothetical protein
MCKDLIHVVKYDEFVSQCSCGTIHEEERKKIISAQRDPLTAKLRQEETVYMSGNSKPLHAPRIVDDVGNRVSHHNLVGHPSVTKHETCIKCLGEMAHSMTPAGSSTPLYICPWCERQCIRDTRHVGGSWIFN